MDSLLDALLCEPDEEYVALRAPGDPPAAYQYGEFVETVWKTGNYFRRLGAHEGATVAIVDHPSAAVPLSIFGAALNGATIRLDPSREVEAKLLVAPGDRVRSFDLPPGAQRVVHSADVDDPAVHSFGEGVWSENPFFPRDRVFVEETAIADGERRLAHRAIVARTVDVAGRVDPGDEVVVHTPLSDVRAVVAGIVAPLYSGGTARIGGDRDPEAGDVCVIPDGETPSDADAIPLGAV